MPIYLDRAGEEITRELWLDLYGDRDYREVRRERLQGGARPATLSVTWVGWCSERERPPRPFVVELHDADGPDKEPVAVEWCASEPKALAKADEIALAYRAGIGGKKGVA
jgi:hypothetical protein